MGKFNDLSGRTFGKLKIIRRSENRRRRIHWLCLCACGNEANVDANNLVSGNSTSCGCQRKESLVRHGNARKGKKTPEYNIWVRMKQRCGDPRSSDYRWYGARGIRVCSRWKDSFPAFLEDMGPKPWRSACLERIDTAKGYEPGNVVWANQLTQMNNMRRNRIVEFEGFKGTMMQASRAFGMPYNTLRSRLNLGWTVERALTKPVF